MTDLAPSNTDGFPSRTRQRLETREKLYQAAVAAFRHSGVSAASVEEIVRAAGVARGTFYLHFPTKDDVLVELLRRNQAVVADRLVGKRRAGAATYLGLAANGMVDWVRSEGPELSREIFMMILRRGTETEDEVAVVTEELEAFFIEAQQRGEARDDLAPHDLMILFLTSVFGLVLMVDDPTSDGIRTSLHQACEVFVRGIAPAAQAELQSTTA